VAGDLIVIEPIGGSVEYEWMAGFAASVADRRLRSRLEASPAGRGAFRRSKSVLLQDLPERDRWFAFRDERLRDAARRWLAAHGIDAATRSGPA
jgi:hypothetical protein